VVAAAWKDGVGPTWVSGFTASLSDVYLKESVVLTKCNASISRREAEAATAMFADRCHNI
jgi:hypothetical protein